MKRAILLFLLWSTWFTVLPEETGIVQRVGAVQRTEGPGLHFKLPFVQDVRRFEKRLLIWDGDPNQIPTKGREFIWVDTTARWRIADAKKFLESVATEAGVPLCVRDSSRGAR